MHSSTGRVDHIGKVIRLCFFDRSLAKDEKKEEFCFGHFSSTSIRKTPFMQWPIKDSIMPIKLTDKSSEMRRQQCGGDCLSYFYLIGSIQTL